MARRRFVRQQGAARGCRRHHLHDLDRGRRGLAVSSGSRERFSRKIRPWAATRQLTRHLPRDTDTRKNRKTESRLNVVADDRGCAFEGLADVSMRGAGQQPPFTLRTPFRSQRTNRNRANRRDREPNKMLSAHPRGQPELARARSCGPFFAANRQLSSPRIIGNRKKAARPRRPPTISLGHRPVIFVSSHAQNFVTPCQSRSMTRTLISESNNSTSNFAMPDSSRHPPQGFNRPPDKSPRANFAALVFGQQILMSAQCN